MSYSDWVGVFIKVTYLMDVRFPIAFIKMSNNLSFSGFNALIDQYVLHVDNIVDVIDTNL